MQNGPMPSDSQSGGASLSPMPAPSPAPPDQAPRNHFAEFVNKRAYIPMWLHPDVAHGVIQHFGKTGHAIVHPHPHSGAIGMASGGIVPQPSTGARGDAAAAAAALVAPPAATARPPTDAAPLAGIPSAGQSIFSGGSIGASGPTVRTPVFARNGTVLDARAGIGAVPGVDLGRDTEHAMLEPGEAVFNKEQLGGITVKKGKGHLVRADQKQAMRKAAKKRNG